MYFLSGSSESPFGVSCDLIGTPLNRVSWSDRIPHMSRHVTPRPSSRRVQTTPPTGRRDKSRPACPACPAPHRTPDPTPGRKSAHHELATSIPRAGPVPLQPHEPGRADRELRFQFLHAVSREMAHAVLGDGELARADHGLQYVFPSSRLFHSHFAFFPLLIETCSSRQGRGRTEGLARPRHRRDRRTGLPASRARQNHDGRARARHQLGLQGLLCRSVRAGVERDCGPHVRGHGLHGVSARGGVLFGGAGRD